MHQGWPPLLNLNSGLCCPFPLTHCFVCTLQTCSDDKILQLLVLHNRRQTLLSFTLQLWMPLLHINEFFHFFHLGPSLVRLYFVVRGLMIFHFCSLGGSTSVSLVPQPFSLFLFGFSIYFCIHFFFFLTFWFLRKLVLIIWSSTRGK